MLSTESRKSQQVARHITVAITVMALSYFGVLSGAAVTGLLVGIVLTFIGKSTGGALSIGICAVTVATAALSLLLPYLGSQWLLTRARRTWSEIIDFCGAVATSDSARQKVAAAVLGAGLSGSVLFIFGPVDPVGFAPGPALQLPTIALTVGIANSLVFAPIFEEMLFRGYLQRALYGAAGFAFSLFVTTALFVLAHGTMAFQTPIRLASMVAMALAVSMLRWRTGAIFASIGFHSGYNLMIVASQFWVARAFLRPLL
jgi:membrane protease YdiL (CAAX protease family)